MDVFFALAEPTRRDIIELLVHDGQMPAGDIYKKFKSTPSAISQHLKILRETKLVRMDKKAQKHIYRANPAAITEVEKWAKQLRCQWEDRLDNLDKFLMNDEERHHER